MKRLLVVLVLLVAGCEVPNLDRIPARPIRIERPTVNLPAALRQANWIGNQRQGSCVHATMISLFRWQGRYNTADYWRQAYANGSWPDDLAAKFDREKVRYAYTTSGDVRFLEWACRTRRGCGITVRGGAHMVTLVHLDDKWAAILDNSNVSKFIWVPRTALIANLPQKRAAQTLAGKLRANGLQRIG